MGSGDGDRRAVFQAGRAAVRRALRAALIRLAGSFGRPPRDEEFEAELESHLQFHIDDNLRAGMTPAEARRKALLKLGGVAQTKERYRDRQAWGWADGFVKDVKYGVRMLRRSPVFTTTILVTLGLGIGVNTAMFSVANAVLFRPLPFPESDRLVKVWATDRESGRTEDVASYPAFEDWRTSADAFEDLAAYRDPRLIVSVDGTSEVVDALQATPGFFELLRIPPALGRTFRPGDELPGPRGVAILGDAAWHRWFGGTADVVGRQIAIDERPFIVIGVMPPWFRFSPSAVEQVYTPIEPDPRRGRGYLHVIGRLAAGVSIDAAQAEMNTITSGLAAEYRQDRNVGANVVPLVGALVGDIRSGLIIVLALVGLVLLVACANVANLMLVRSASRRTELAVRVALGAGRARLLQQFLVESAILALAGGAVGLLVSQWTSRLLVSVLGHAFDIPRLSEVGLDLRVAAFAVVTSGGAALVFGVMQAVAAGSNDPSVDLSGSARLVGHLRQGRMRRVLAVAEAAFAVLLLVGAAALLKSLLALQATPPGFRSSNLLVVDFRLPQSKVTDTAARLAYFDRLIDRTKVLPDVVSASLVADLPVGGGWDELGFRIPGREGPREGFFTARFNVVGSGYFRTMAIPLRAGRGFTAVDTANVPGVIVVNEAAARRFWPDGALGQQMLLDFTGGSPVAFNVVGIAGDVRQSGLGRQPEPEVFLNYRQPGPNWPYLSMVVRTESEPAALSDTIRDIAASVDPGVPISSIRTSDDVLARSLAAPRTYSMLVGAFAALALALAVVGLYGVIAYGVTRRTREIGVRIALGAQPRAVAAMVVGEGLRLSAAGAALGLTAGIGLNRVLRELEPTATSYDPLVLAVVAVTLLGAAALASYLPARRAARVDPTTALRAE